MSKKPVKPSLRKLAALLTLGAVVLPLLAGCVVVPARGWHHGYWVRGHWVYR